MNISPERNSGILCTTTAMAKSTSNCVNSYVALLTTYLSFDRAIDLMNTFPNGERYVKVCSNTGRVIVVVQQRVIFVTYSAALDVKVPVYD
jgi:hypothetical protein